MVGRAMAPGTPLCLEVYEGPRGVLEGCFFFYQFALESPSTAEALAITRNHLASLLWQGLQIMVRAGTGGVHGPRHRHSQRHRLA